MLDLAALAVVDEFDERLRAFDGRAADDLTLELRIGRERGLGVERREVVVVVLRPPFERMVVALVAVEAHGEEQLRRVLHHGVGRAEHLEVRGGRVVHVRPRCREDRIRELVVGHVGGDRIANPLAERGGPDFAQEFAIHLKQVGPLVRPQFDERFAADELVDYFIALDLCFALVQQERSHLFRRRRQTGEIDVHAPNKVRIVAEFARLHLHLLELGVDQFVDPVVDGALFPDEAGAVAHAHGRTRGIRAFITGEHRRFAAANRREQARLVDGRDFVVARIDERLGRHVAHAAVGIASDGGELLLRAELAEDRILGEDFERLHAGGFEVLLDALGDPLAEQFVVGVAGLREDAALMRHGPGCLQEHEALFRCGAVESASFEIVGEGAEIVDGVVASE